MESTAVIPRYTLWSSRLEPNTWLVRFDREVCEGWAGFVYMPLRGGPDEKRQLQKIGEVGALLVSELSKNVPEVIRVMPYKFGVALRVHRDASTEEFRENLETALIHYFGQGRIEFVQPEPQPGGFASDKAYILDHPLR